MTEVRPRSCMVPGCGKIPSYGVDGKREVCRDHKAQGMTYAVLTCESPHCNKNPSFAPRGETRRRFCKRHAEPHMVNVYYKYCDVGQCPERAFFESGEKLRCLQHIEPGMKPRNNICQVLGGGCTRQSSYGPDGGKPVVCTIHKQPGMVQVHFVYFLFCCCCDIVLELGCYWFLLVLFFILFRDHGFLRTNWGRGGGGFCVFIFPPPCGHQACLFLHVLMRFVLLGFRTRLYVDLFVCLAPVTIQASTLL